MEEADVSSKLFVFVQLSISSGGRKSRSFISVINTYLASFESMQEPRAISPTHYYVFSGPVHWNHSGSAGSLVELRFEGGFDEIARFFIIPVFFEPNLKALVDEPTGWTCWSGPVF